LEAGTGDWLTVPQAAEALHIARTRCYELIARGDLPAVRLGQRSIRVHKGELERFLLEDRRVVVNQFNHHLHNQA
jgi:excisionase family DNA binding protein